MAAQPLMISSCFTYSFILAVLFSFTRADVTVIQGKIQGPSIKKFSIADRGIQLICDPDEFKDSNGTLPQWTLIQSGNITVPDAAISCKGKRSTSHKSDGPVKPLDGDCAVKLSENSSLILNIDDINSNEFGDYVCHTGNMSHGNLTIRLREIVHLYRKNEKGKQLRSLIVNVGDPLFIYCNHTGYHESKHDVSWWRDGIDITQEIKNATGDFENFTRTDELSYNGIARLEHRGNYTCQVDLKEGPKEQSRFYPVQFSYFVRIKEGTEWQLPLYILLVECALIALFTLIISMREKRLEESDYTIDDSEDEDDVQSSKSNGTQNNNSHGK